MGKYYVTIGLEMHCEGSKTNSKVFSGARNDYSDLPNSNIRPIDLGLPGTLPVVNKEAVRMALMMSLVLHAKQPDYMYFERKNYYYPDMPKNFQITQNPPEDCVGMGGYLDIVRDDGSTFRVDIDNLHLEEDAASMNHLYDTSVIDYNRAGAPLFELVTMPSIHSADDAVAFLEYVRAIYQYCNISEADSKKGQIRCDVNISISDSPDTLGTKVEIKNVNSFGGVHDCIQYEIKRQSELKDAERYDEVVQETRRWDEESGTTIRMRSKVDAEDYKYFVEPNIPKFRITPEWIEEIRASIPELPYERKAKYMEEYGLSEYDAGILVKDINTAEYFEKSVRIGSDPKMTANWITGNIMGYIYKYDKQIQDLYLNPKRLNVILTSMANGKISSKQAKELFFMVLERENEPEDIMKAEGMEQISDTSALSKIICEILDNNPNQIEQYHNGKTNMFDFFVGQTMKATRGQANPVVVKEILTEELGKR